MRNENYIRYCQVFSVNSHQGSILNSFHPLMPQSSESSMLNLFSGFGIKSITAEESEEEKEERSPLRQSIQGVFTPLSAYAFIAFVLLYWPCVVVAIATRQEFGTWKIYGQAVLIHTALAWITAFVIYQGGRLLGFG